MSVIKKRKEIKKLKENLISKGKLYNKLEGNIKKTKNESSFFGQYWITGKCFKTITTCWVEIEIIKKGEGSKAKLKAIEL